MTLGVSTYDGLRQLSPFEEEKRRYVPYAEFGGRLSVLVNVHLGHLYLSCVFFGQLLHDRA